MDEAAHRLEERAEHLTALVADVAHHLQLLVDDHEELVDLLLVAEEVEELGCATSPSRGIRKVPLIGFIRTSPPWMVTCRSGLAPIRYRSPVKNTKVQYAPRSRSSSRRNTVSALSAPQSATARAVVPADDEVGALALADLVADDRARRACRTPRRRSRTRRGRRTRRRCRRSRRPPRRRRTPARSRRRPRPAGCRRRAPRSRARGPAGTARRAAGRRCARPAARPPRAVRRGSTRPRARRPPTRPTVSRSPARVERRMIAHASCPWRAAMASRAEGVVVMAEL